MSAIGLLLALVALLLGVRTSSAKETLQSEPDRQVPAWIRAERLPRAAVQGAHLFAQSGCTACHTYLGSGSSNLGAPDLTREGRRGRGISWQVRYLTRPASVSAGALMPPFAALGRPRLRQIAVFLEASKGRR